jgi:YfiH family protein
VADTIPGADALVTTEPGLVLVTQVGDCVPIVLYDPVAGVLASVHAGWRGTVAGVSRAALEAMASLGSRPADVLAGLGPAIAPDRYQVGPEVAACFTNPAGILRPDGTGKWLLDLWAANRRLLREAGVPDAQIHVATVPTGPGPLGPGPFFSDRTARPCGRFALVARLKLRGNP